MAAAKIAGYRATINVNLTGFRRNGLCAESVYGVFGADGVDFSLTGVKFAVYGFLPCVKLNDNVCLFVSTFYQIVCTR